MSIVLSLNVIHFLGMGLFLIVFFKVSSGNVMICILYIQI